MATCIGCDAEIDTAEVEIGETLTCAECGADMEVVSLRPLELELVDDSDEEDEADDEDDDEPEEDEEI
jgi:alpha-aminoadipate carrier protein LysW